jgi:uncharacterized membrane protein
MLVAVVAIVLCLPSNVVLYGKIFADLAAHSRPYYIPKEVANAFSWLAESAAPHDVVLSHPQNGYHLPVDASVTAFVGHGHFTIDYAEKSRLVARFFDAAESDDFRKRLLETFTVKYVFYGDLERNTGAFNPSAASYLEPVYSNSLVTIYEAPSETRMDTD